jgi:uncharacterized protein
MKKLVILLPLLIAAAALFTTAQPTPTTKKLKVLIIDGQNNHKWATTTPLLKKILENSDRFTVDVSTSPPDAPKGPKLPKLPKNATPEEKAKRSEEIKAAATEHKVKMVPEWEKWRPNFSDYDVVVSNYNGEDWPQAVKEGLVSFVKNGGGFVSYHAADNPFANWPEYNQMIGLGGWGGRDEKSGPYLRLKNGIWTKVDAPGPGGGHGPQSRFTVEMHSPEHPISKGLPAKWKHTQDELYENLRGPANNITVIGSANSESTKEQQPMLMVIPFGKGRVFHTTLGHDVTAVEGLGFQVTFSRGTEWAATGNVTQVAPTADELPDGPIPAVRRLTVGK